MDFTLAQIKHTYQSGNYGRLYVPKTKSVLSFFSEREITNASVKVSLMTKESDFPTFSTFLAYDFHVYLFHFISFVFSLLSVFYQTDSY